MKDTTEKIQRVIKSYGIRTLVKPTKKLKHIQCKPKDRLELKEVCGPVYKLVCGGSEGEDCPAHYVGETKRTLKVRFAEHRRPSSYSSEVSKHINKEVQLAGYLEQTNLVICHVTSQITSTAIKAPARAFCIVSKIHNLWFFVILYYIVMLCYTILYYTTLHSI